MGDQPLPSSFDGDADFYNESIFRRIGRRLKEEPLIPIGLGVTCWALYNAQQSIRSGNSIKTNRFFRYRLYAQGFTFVAMLGGTLYYKSDRLKKKEYTKMKDKQKEQEKREAWIRELEIRDKEDQEWREKLGRVKDLQREEEERLAVLEMQQKRDIGNNERKVANARALRKQENGTKAFEDNAGRPVLEKPASVTGQEEQESESKEKYGGVLGEGDIGGLFGVGHLKGFYEHRMKPAFGIADDKKKEGPDKTKTKD